MSETASSEVKKSARAKIEVEGEVPQETVENVIDAAGPKKRGQQEKIAPTRFERAIRDPSNRIIATRIAPQTTADGKVLGDQYEIMPTDTLTEAEIKQDIAQARGGQKWHIRVLDSEDRVVAAKNVIVPGEPRVDPVMESFDPLVSPSSPPMPHHGRRHSMETYAATSSCGEESASERLTNDPDILAKRKELEILRLQTDKERREAELAEARARRAAAERALRGDGEENGHAKKKTDDEVLREAIEAALRPLREENERLRRRDEERERMGDFQRMIEAATAPIKATQESLAKTMEALALKVNSPPPPPQGPSMQEVVTSLTAKLDALKSEVKLDVERQLNTALTTLTSKYDAQFQSLIHQINTIATRPGDAGLAKEAVGALTAIATKGGPGGAAADPFSLVEKTVGLVKNVGQMTGMIPGSQTPTDFPTFLVEKLTSLAPEVMDFVERRQREAVAVTREEVEKKMRELGIKMWQELDNTIKSEIRGAFSRARTFQESAAPAAAPTVAVPVATKQAVSTPVATAPPPAVAVATAPPPMATVSAPPSVVVQQEQSASPPTQDKVVQQFQPQQAAPVHADQKQLEDIYRKRVNAVLKLLHHEMQLGVQGMTWPQKAWEWLPKNVLDGIVASKTDQDVYEVVKPWADPAMLESIWNYLKDSYPQHQWYREWLSNGINWIKEASGAETVEPPDENEGELNG